jgi:hypothetical protein
MPPVGWWPSLAASRLSERRPAGCCRQISALLILKTSSLSGKAKASTTILNPVPELALPSAAVRRCMPAAVAVVTQLDTQPLQIAQAAATRPSTRTRSAPVVERHFVSSLNRTVAPLVEHKLLFCSVPTLDEALYLAAFINSTPAQDFLTSYANITGVTPRALKTLPIPPFNMDNPDIMILVASGQRIVSASGAGRDAAIDAEREAINSATVRLGELDPDTYQPQPRRQPQRRRKPPTFSNQVTLPGFD